MSQKFKEHREARSAANAGCILCEEEPLQAFEYWKVIPNLFPYDRIARGHDMLVPLRHVILSDLTIEEDAELKKIKQEYLAAHYDYLLEGVPKNQSVKDHYHLHLIVGL